MQKIFDKSKILNYIVASLFLTISVIFISQVSFYLWNFDIFNIKQITSFIKYIANGKIFHSVKYISFVISFIGLCFITYSGIIISLNLEFLNINFLNKNNKKTNEENETSITQEALKNATLEIEKDNTDEKNQEISITKENPFEIYNTLQKEIQNNTQLKQNNLNEELNKNDIIKKEENQLPIQEQDNYSTEEDREKLQAKIKEIMNRIKQRKAELNDENDNKEIKQDEKKLKEENKILESINFAKNNSIIDMNFAKISEEENAFMEHTLISAGFKLLSEIRIGSTGIDYLGIAKDKIVLVQLDTSEGNWFASEDKVEGNENPVWFSEAGNKISPIARAIEAKDNIEKLLNNEINLPIETVACLSKSKVVNIFEAQEEWNKLGIKVVQLNNNEENEEPQILQTLADIYPQQSQEEIDEKDMNKIINILEKAEIPE